MNRSKTLDYFTDDRELIYSNLIRLLEEPFYPLKPIRLLGIHLSNFGENTEMGYQQLELKF
jgi:nucleotidyltransferase/DNA polymerase involved in DNA repair